MSCQKGNFEVPDADTKQEIIDEAQAHFGRLEGCSGPLTMDFTTNLIGTRDRDYTAEELLETGLTSNCYRSGNDVNDATHRVTARCHAPQGWLDVLTGQRKAHVHAITTAQLRTCDMRSEAQAQIEEDLKKVAAHNMLVNRGQKVEYQELACDFEYVPML